MKIKVGIIFGDVPKPIYSSVEKLYLCVIFHLTPHNVICFPINEGEEKGLVSVLGLKRSGWFAIHVSRYFHGSLRVAEENENYM